MIFLFVESAFGRVDFFLGGRMLSRGLFQFLFFISYIFCHNAGASVDFISVDVSSPTSIKVSLNTPVSSGGELWQFNTHLFENYSPLDYDNIDFQDLENYLLQPQIFYRSKSDFRFYKVRTFERQFEVLDIKSGKKIILLKNHSLFYLILTEKVLSAQGLLELQKMKAPRVIELTEKNMPRYFKKLENQPFFKAYNIERFPEKKFPMQNINTIKSSVRKFDRLSCSGFFVSNEGHFLTALHCISAMLENLDFVQSLTTGAGNELRRIGGLLAPSANYLGATLEDFSKPLTPDLVYSASLAGLTSLPTPKILAIGAGWFPGQPRENSIPAVKKAFSGGDWALLKYDTQTTCLKTSGQSPVGEQTFGLGYPAKDLNNGMPNVNRKLFVSVGEVVPSFQSQYPYILTKGGAASFAYYDQIMTEEKLSVLGLSNIGMSGGPILNSESDVIGMTSTALPLYLSPSSEGSMPIKISHIKHEIKELLGDQKTQEVFKCVH